MPPRKRVDPDDTNAGSSYGAKHRASRNPGKHPIGSRIPMAGPDSHEGDERGKRAKGRRGGPKHEAPTPPRKRAAKAAPTSSAPTSSAPSSSPPTRTGPTMAAGPATRRAGARAERVGEEARYLAQQAAIRSTTAKPSVTGRAAAGAASGAAVGTAVGGPVGTAVGGGLGAVVGGVSGASAKKAYKASMRPYPGARRALVAEFAVCAVLVALSPMGKDQKPGQWMRRMTAVMGLFFILGLVSTAGRWGARAAAGFGGIVTLALVVSERKVFSSLTGAFSTTRDGSASFGAAPPGVDSGSSSMSGGIDDMQPAEGG